MKAKTTECERCQDPLCDWEPGLCEPCKLEAEEYTERLLSEESAAEWTAMLEGWR